MCLVYFQETYKQYHSGHKTRWKHHSYNFKNIIVLYIKSKIVLHIVNIVNPTQSTYSK